jgi:hypothetical protein
MLSNHNTSIHDTSIAKMPMEGSNKVHRRPTRSELAVHRPITPHISTPVIKLTYADHSELFRVASLKLQSSGYPSSTHITLSWDCATVGYMQLYTENKPPRRTKRGTHVGTAMEFYILYGDNDRKVKMMSSIGYSDE